MPLATTLVDVRMQTMQPICNGWPFAQWVKDFITIITQLLPLLAYPTSGIKSIRAGGSSDRCRCYA